MTTTTFLAITVWKTASSCSATVNAILTVFSRDMTVLQHAEEVKIRKNPMQ